MTQSNEANPLSNLKNNNKKIPAQLKEDLINTALDKTGFVLEDYITEEFESRGWTTIPNRYYVDDSSSAVREIDLIAYKTTKIAGIMHYTALIVSCKKNARHAFAFLVRDKNEKDPNVDWHPIKIWSNSKPISFYLENSFRTEWVEFLKKEGLYANTLHVGSKLFASQEIGVETGTANNDTNIFNSITTLMKAQAYELISLNSRRSSKTSTYSMHLITATDCEMYRVCFKGGHREVTSTTDENFVYNYIIGSQETSSQIRFTHKSRFSDVIESYGLYHDQLAKFIERKQNDFYNGILTDTSAGDRRSYILNEIEDSFKIIFSAVTNSGKDDIRVSLGFDSHSNEVIVHTSLSDDEIATFKRRTYLMKSLESNLIFHYQYHGKFDVREYPDSPF